MDKKSFILYCDYKQHIDMLDRDGKADLLEYIFNYVAGEEVEPVGNASFVFSFIKAQLDRDEEKYNKFKEKQRINGSKGGRPKEPNAKPKNPVVKSETQKSLTDTVTVNDTVNDIKKSITKVIPKKVGSRFSFEKHVNDEWAVEASRLKPDFTKQDIQEQMETFTDYWNGVAGAKGVKLDWLATWRNWIRRATVQSRKGYRNTERFSISNWVNE